MTQHMEVGMLNNFKNKAPEQDRSTVANDLEFLQPQRLVAETIALRSERTKSGPVSCIGSDMSVVGKIETDGPAQVFGRIEGEVRASDLMIGNGAQIEGTLRKTSQSVAASRARSAPAVLNSIMAVQLRAIFSIARCRSTRTPCLKDRRD